MTDSKTVESVIEALSSASDKHKSVEDTAQFAIAAMQSLGWQPPADVEAACVAAQRDAFTMALQVVKAHELEMFGAANAHPPDSESRDRCFVRVLTCETISSNISALSPSPGPWPRVPEGWTVARLKPTAEMIEAGVDAHYPGDEVVYPDEWETPDQAVIASYRAMIAAGGKP